MIVCHCHGISDREIREVVRTGAASTPQVARECGAGRTCRGCLPVIEGIIREEGSSEPRPAAAAAAGS